MLFRRSKIMCPYCFNDFKPGDILFRCLNDDCKTEDDQILAKYMGLGVLNLKAVLPPPAQRKYYRSGIPWKTVCPECDKETTQTICPVCHNVLPPGFGHEKSFNIALVGGAAVGKSNYIGVMINELDKRVLPSLGCSIRKKGEYTKSRYYNDFYKPLFEDNLVANPVKRTYEKDKDVRNPMFFRIDFPKRRKYWVKTYTPGVDLNFFDAAGDVLKNADRSTVLARYIGNADALILVLDPLQCRTIRGKLIASGISKTRLPAEEDQHELFQTIIGFYKQINGIKPTTPIRIPVAVAFSKIDALRVILPVDTAIMKNTLHKNGIDVNEIEEIDEELRGYMLSQDDWDLANIFTAANNNLSNYKFFAFSALGDMPNEKNELRRGVVGIRVADPLMWLLHRMKMLAGKL